MITGQKRKNRETELPSPQRTSPSSHPSRTTSIDQSPTTRRGTTISRETASVAATTITKPIYRDPRPFSGDEDDDDEDDVEDSDLDSEMEDNDNTHHHHHHQSSSQPPPLHIPDITWRTDLLPPFHPSHYLTEATWELWHNDWLSLLLATGVPHDGHNRFLVSIRDDYVLGARMRMTMTADTLRGDPACENQLVEFVSARDLWRWLPVTFGDFTAHGRSIRIVRADQPARIRGRTWMRWGREVDVEALKEGDGYDETREG